MIPAPPGLTGRYRTTGKTGSDRYGLIAAFDDDGYPLVIDVEAGRLVPALSIEVDLDEIVSMIPAGGWRIEYPLDDGKKLTRPLVGWGLKPNGSVVPLDTDEIGYVCDMRYHDKEDWRLYHPDAEEPTSGNQPSTKS